jgi:hypothetical protein
MFDDLAKPASACELEVYGTADAAKAGKKAGRKGTDKSIARDPHFLV